MIEVIFATFISMTVLSLLSYLLLPPQPRAVGAAIHTQADGVAYFEKLADISTTTTTSTPIETTTRNQQVQTTIPAPAPIATGNCDLVFGYDWPQATALRICLAESSGNPDAVNMSDDHGKCRGSFGLMQIACFWFPFFGHSISYDPNINIEIAYKIWKRNGGFRAWSTY